MTAIIYITAIVLANLSVSYFGPSVTPINAFLFIGLDLTLRNYLAATYSTRSMLALIAAAGGISYALNPASGIIAIASVCAFVASAATDWAVFKMANGSWIKRCMSGVSAGALVDSILFPTIAFGALMPEIVAAQFAAKVLGGAVWAYVIGAAKARLGVE